MKFEKIAEEVIRNEWFVNHRIEQQIGNKELCKFSFKAPNTTLYSIEYIISGSFVFVTGHLGEAVFSFPFPVSLEELNEYDLENFTSKIVTFSKNQWHFDRETAINDLHDYWNRKNMTASYPDHKLIQDGILAAICKSTTVEEYTSELLPIISKSSANSYLLNDACEFGKCIPTTLIAIWIGLREVIQLQSNLDDGKCEVEVAYFKDLLQYAEYSTEFIILGDEFSDDKIDDDKITTYLKLLNALEEQGINYFKVSEDDLKSLQYAQKEFSESDEYSNQNDNKWMISFDKENWDNEFYSNFKTSEEAMLFVSKYGVLRLYNEWLDVIGSIQIEKEDSKAMACCYVGQLSTSNSITNIQKLFEQSIY